MNRFLLAVCVLLATSFVAAQEPRTNNPTIDLQELAFRLVPLTEPELAVETKAWITIFAAKAQEIADKQIATLAADASAKTALESERAKLRIEREAILERATIVLDAWKDKGGKAEDIEAHEKYMARASGDRIGLGEVWTTVSTWLTSETGGIKVGLNILLFLITIFVFRILSRLAGRLMTKVVDRMSNVSILLRKFCINFVTKFTTVIGLIVALTMLGVDVTPFLAVIGATGFIIGFALQGTLNNFASGIMILIYRPFDVGNVVTVAGITGTVDKVSMSSTTVKTGDNQVIIIPNGKIWGDIITNITGSDTRRVDLVFGIGYGDDIGKAESILSELVDAHALVLKDPKPNIRLHELADSSVNFICRPWANTGDYWTVYWDLTRAVKERFDAEGISIPFPQTDVHLHQVTAE